MFLEWIIQVYEKVDFFLESGLIHSNESLRADLVGRNYTISVCFVPFWGSRVRVSGCYLSPFDLFAKALCVLNFYSYSSGHLCLK